MGIALLVLAAVFVTFPAFAAIDGDGVLDDVTARFLGESAEWGDTIKGYLTYKKL